MSAPAGRYNLIVLLDQHFRNGELCSTDEGPEHQKVIVKPTKKDEVTVGIGI